MDEIIEKKVEGRGDADVGVESDVDVIVGPDQISPPLPTNEGDGAAPAPPVTHTQPSLPPMPAVRLAKKLIVFSDGTGNSSAKAEKTNVWRLFQALDLTTSDQLALYDDGVGTSTNKYVAAIGGAFGYGLKRNVIDLYKFICRNYDDDSTDIYGFGFSRGAFTIRVLMGLITSEGLVHFSSEEELHRRAVEAYSHFRRKCFKPPFMSPVYAYRFVRRLLRAGAKSLRNEPYERRARRHVNRIRFLGLWDTVSAYGMPIAELKPAINWLFWPMNFSDHVLSAKVERAVQALSLDDERTTFHPIPWDESHEQNQKRITQVWFAGVHANVGGGYPEDQLSLVSLDWMMRHAMDNGLRLQPACVERISNEKSSFGKIYDARAGLGAFYRYAPRDIKTCAERCTHVLPIVHGSVIARMARGADAYVPNSLPANFLVLAPDGQLLPMEGFPEPHTRNYIAQAAPATAQILDVDIADARTRALKQAMTELSRPDQPSIEAIKNAVWWRRAAYLSSSIVLTAMVLFPWIAHTAHVSLKNYARTLQEASWAGALPRLSGKIVQWDQEFRGIITTGTDALNAYLPPMLDRWIESIAKYPVEFGILAVLFGLSLRGGELLRRSLRDYGLLAWHAPMREPFRTSLLATEVIVYRRTCIWLFAFDAVALWLWLTFADKAVNPLRPLALAIGMLNALALTRIYWHRRFMRVLGKPEEAITDGMATQQLAQVLRHSRVLKGINHAIGHFIAPVLFGFAMLFLMAVTVNKVALDVEGASGLFCQGTIADTAPRVGRLAEATSKLSVDKFCWASGLRLEKRTRYRVIIDDADGNWADRKMPTDPYGFRANNMLHVLATPLKRWIQEPWMAPIAHVGIKGNEEYALKPCVYRRRAPSPNNGVEFLAYPDKLGDAEASTIKASFPTPAERRVLVAEFTPKSNGELFIYANDAALGLPRVADYFYKNNRGSATVRVEEVHGDDRSEYHTYCPK